MSLKFEAYRELLSMEILLRRKDFAAICDRVRRATLGARRRSTPEPAEICRAVDLASVFYFHQVLCLQRSASAACLLRKHGFAAQLVIGVQQLPFAAHAWVELDGAVLNDKPYMNDIYAVLERC